MVCGGDGAACAGAAAWACVWLVVAGAIAAGGGLVAEGGFLVLCAVALVGAFFGAACACTRFRQALRELADFSVWQ